MTDARLQCPLFDTLIRPILSCGCKIWAVEANHKDIKQLEVLHLDLSRMILFGSAKTWRPFLHHLC